MDFAETFASGHVSSVLSPKVACATADDGLPKRQRLTAGAERFEIRRLKSWCVMPDEIVRRSTTNCQLLTQISQAVHKLKSAVK